MTSNKEEKDIVLADYFNFFLKNIHWIIIVCIISAVLGYFKVRYQDKIFQSQGSLKIESDNNNLLSDVALFKDINPKDKILTEAYIIKSRNLILKACKKLPIQVSYFSKGRVVNKELYTSSPFLVSLVKKDSTAYDKPYSIVLSDKKSYVITKVDEQNDPIELKANFGDTISFDNHILVIINNAGNYDISDLAVKNYEFVINSPNALYGRISGNLDVSQLDKGVSMLNITYKDFVPQFAADFINELMKVYTEFDVETKSQTATQTITFMERLIKDMDMTVQNSEQNVEKFKKTNNIFDLEAKGEYQYKELTDLELQRRMAGLQLLSIESVERQIAENKSSVTLPVSIEGVVDPVLTDLLSALNKLNIERIARNEKVTSYSPNLIEIDKQIAEVRDNIKQTVLSSRKRIKEQISFFEKKITVIQSNMQSLPTEEKQFFALKRDLEVNQRVYAYLLQTRLEAAISRASIVSSARTIDLAEIAVVSVEPNGKLIFLLYLVFGLITALLLLIAVKLLKTEIYSVTDIELLTDIPVVGTIIAFGQKLTNNDSRMLAIKEQRTLFGESVRTVRTNLQFLLPEKKKKIITFTSTISGEGKTFSSINLAGSLTMLDKKVVLIGCDLRRPQMFSTFKTSHNIGLSTYLSGEVTLADIIQKTEFEGLSLIAPGPIPPNPAELLNSDLMKVLLDELIRDFDYVILDTSPVGLVSDAIVLMKLSDINIYVLKSGYSKLNYLELPSKIMKEHNLSHMYLLLNSYKIDKFSRKGGYYGYGNGSNGYYDIKERKKYFFGLFSKTS